MGYKADITAGSLKAPESRIIADLLLRGMADEYVMYNDPKCVLESSNESGQLIILLRDDGRLYLELRPYAHTDKYLKTKAIPASPNPLYWRRSQRNWRPSPQLLYKTTWRKLAKYAKSQIKQNA